VEALLDQGLAQSSVSLGFVDKVVVFEARKGGGRDLAVAEGEVCLELGLLAVFN
jgi:hypothetical protein